MKRLNLPNVTLLMVDCLNLDEALFVLNHCMQLCSFASVKLLTHFDFIDSRQIFSSPNFTSNFGLLPPPTLVKIAPITSRQQYSFFMMKELHKYVNTEFVLICQTDGFIVNPSAWTEDFLKYDYIGAPWLPYQIQFGNPQHMVGNGGFSLRSKRLCDFLAQDQIINVLHPEDLMIGQKYRPYLERVAGIKFAPIELAHKFSCEQYIWNNSFGHHDYFSLDKMFKRRFSVPD